MADRKMERTDKQQRGLATRMRSVVLLRKLRFKHVRSLKCGQNPLARAQEATFSRVCLVRSHGYSENNVARATKGEVRLSEAVIFFYQYRSPGQSRKSRSEKTTRTHEAPQPILIPKGSLPDIVLIINPYLINSRWQDSLVQD